MTEDHFDDLVWNIYESEDLYNLYQAAIEIGGSHKTWPSAINVIRYSLRLV